MSFRFLEDIATADVAFEARGETREEMFSAAAEALLATMVHDPATVEAELKQPIQLEEEALDLLLFSFLNELVFYKDARRLLLRVESLLIGERGGMFRLDAVLAGETIDAGRHPLLVDVKAATMHRLSAEYVGGWRATVVLDV